MAVSQLADTLQTTTLDNTPLIFSPNAHAGWQELQLEPVPRFLYRIYTPQSDGFTNETVASSRDAARGESGSNEDIFATKSPKTTAKLIADHLWWQWGERKDNLVSWSSSMLFLIRYIFYRQHVGDKKSPLDDIRLLVVDTDEFQAHTFIRDTDLISAFKPYEKGLESLAKIRANSMYFGEYLSQGSLSISGKCSTVSAQTMITRGLLDLQFIFKGACEGEDPRGWAVPVQDIRNTIRATPNAQPASPDVMNKAIEIACEFEQGWRLPTAVHLLALLPYKLEPRKVYDRLWTRMRPSEDEIDRCATYWQTIHAPLSMPELIRGQSIMKKLLVMHVQAKINTFLQARTILSMNLRTIAQCSGENSAAADALERSLDTLVAGNMRLGELV